MKEPIFATKERQELLKDWDIEYAVDTELCFIFKSSKDEELAIQILECACEL